MFETDSKLKTYREKIDNLDAEILVLLCKRFEMVKKIGIYKKNKKINVIQQDRIREIIQKVEKFALCHRINPILFKKIYRSIIESSCEMEFCEVEDGAKSKWNMD